MNSDRNLRDMLRVLIQKFGRTRNSLMAANAIIRAISSMSRDQRGALTPAQIEAELKIFLQQLATQHDPAFVDMDKVLAGDQPFENELGKFVADIRW